MQHLFFMFKNRGFYGEEITLKWGFTPYGEVDSIFLRSGKRSGFGKREEGLGNEEDQLLGKNY